VTRGPNILACLIVLAMAAVTRWMGGCSSPPDARNICAAPPVDRALWTKACEGMFQPRRPPEGLCTDPDGRQLWPFDWAVRCKG